MKSVTHPLQNRGKEGGKGARSEGWAGREKSETAVKDGRREKKSRK